MDKAGKSYWDDSWRNIRLPKEINPRNPGIRNFINRRFHKYFFKVFSANEFKGKKLLEIGCAKSSWLPYFAKEFGFKVYGIDYSEIGCQLAKRALESGGMEANIVCCDFFSPPGPMLAYFDVVVSFGVAEHFEDTSECIASFSKFVRPGGLMFTMIPNMVGAIGFFQKLIDRSVYEIHMLLDEKKLKKAHEITGLEVLESDYFIFTNFLVVNPGRIQSIFRPIKKVLWWCLVCSSVATWFLEDTITGPLKSNKLISPYINCLTKKPL